MKGVINLISKIYIPPIDETCERCEKREEKLLYKYESVILKAKKKIEQINYLNFFR